MMILTTEPRRLTEPYSFDVPAYAGCYDFADAAMDRRHVYLLNEILCSHPFACALELGSFNGASATAFVEAINCGRGLGVSGVATFCDVAVTDSLVDVARNCRDPKRARITPIPSWMVLDSSLPFDFILVDASHDEDTVTLELKRLMRRRPLCVMAHDTAATEAGYSGCEGAAMLKRTFVADAGYHCLEDCRKRDGERTERGLFFATTDRGLYETAKGIYEKWT